MKKKVMLIAILFVLVLLIGASYAAFKYYIVTNVNYIERHNIEMEFLESDDTINLTSALPMNDKQGISQIETFDFQIKTKTKNEMSIGYAIFVEKLEVSSGATSLDDDEIKIYLTDFEDAPLIIPSLVSDLDSYELYKKYHSHNSSVEEVTSKFKVKIWIDEDVDVSDWDENTNLQYSFKLNVRALNNKTYKVVFNSNNGEDKQEVQYIGYDEEFKLEKNNFGFTGYNFDGWASSEAGAILYDDNEKVLNISGDENVINLYAQWETQKSYKNYYVFDMMEEEAVIDNTASQYVESSDGIKFNNPSSKVNGKGLYTMSSTIDDEYPIHYYRGGVNNNNVVINNYCWKILRTTETGGIKLLFNGLMTEDGNCNNSGGDTLLYTKKTFNGTGVGIAGAGYSYTDKTSLKLSVKNDSAIAVGTIFASDAVYDENTGLYTLSNDRYLSTSNFTEEKYDNIKNHHFSCLKTTDEGCASVSFFYMARNAQVYYATLKNGQTIDDLLNIEFEGNSTNQVKSSIHTTIETWYAEKMTGITSYLEDTVYCNDRSLYNTWSSTSSIENNEESKLHFGAKKRVAFTEDISLDCKYKADSFTTSTATGNGALLYPVGLITFDEAALAGVVWNKESSNSFIHNGYVWWTMSPGFVSATGVYIGVIHSMLDHVAVNYTSSVAGGVRPVISLKSGMKIEDGAGSTKNPFTLIIE